MNVSSALSTAGITTETSSKVKTSQSAQNLAPTTDTYSSKISEIATKYDPRHIALDKIPKLAKELYDNGLISDVDAMVMSSQPYLEQRLEKDGRTLGLSERADGTVDLLKHWQGMVSCQRTSEATEGVAQTTNTLEALSSYHQRPPEVNNATVDTQNSVDIRGAISGYKTAVTNATLDVQRVVDALQMLAFKSDY